MTNIIHWLLPKEEQFFDMLAEQSRNALDGANELKIFVSNYHKFDNLDRKSKCKAIKKIEDKGDEITRKIIDKLNTTFITPIDKEDIHQMAILLDDVIDLIDAVVLRFALLGIERIDTYILKLVNIIVGAVSEINKSIADLRKLRNMKEHYIKMHRLENEADDIYHEALAELFHFYKNPIDIIKYKEIYEILERVVDECDNLTRVIESVVVKHA